jgi:hypothetical protein
VAECDAAPRLTPQFIERAQLLSSGFFQRFSVEFYEKYWLENKVGDFDFDRAWFKVPVFVPPAAALKKEIK